MRPFLGSGCNTRGMKTRSRCSCSPIHLGPRVSWLLLFLTFYFVLEYSWSRGCDNFRWTPRASTMHTFVSILSHTPLPSRLPHNMEQSSLCYMVGYLVIIHFKRRRVTCINQRTSCLAPILPAKAPSNPSSFPKSVSLFLFVNKLICTPCLSDSACKGCYLMFLLSTAYFSQHVSL